MKTKSALLCAVANLLLFGSSVLQAGLTPLTLNCSSNLVAVATSANGAAVSFTVTASGGCGQPSVTATPPSGSTFPIGTTTVTVTATDACDHTNSCSFTVTVVNSSCLMSIFCPSNIVMTSSVPTAVFFTVSASDTCGGLPTIVSMPLSGTTFPIGTTMVTNTAYDSNGTNTCSFTVTVVKPNCQMLIFCPSNIVMTSSVPTAVFFTVSASDTCGGLPTIVSMPPSGTTFPIGTTTVTNTAYDSNGTSTCSFTVTVVKPNCQMLISCPPNIMMTSNVPTAVFFTVSASDTCGGLPTIVSVPPSGTTFPIGTTMVTNTAYDSNGTNTCSFTVTVVKPNCQMLISCPPNIVMTSSVPTAVFFTVSASDTCGGLPNIVSMPPSGTTFPIGTTTVTNTAYDSNGTNTCSFTVTVTPAANPQADLQITKTAVTNAIFVGRLASFTITLTNLGPDTASNITVIDLLPPGLTYSSAGVPGSTSFDETNDTWSIPLLAAGNGYALALTARANKAGTFTNTATLTSSTPPDTNTVNNSASAVVTATVQLVPADLQLSKTANPTNATTGQLVVFVVSLSNLGPNNVTNSIVVTDCLPVGFEYVTDSTFGGAGIGSYSPGTCWWTLTGLGADATVYLTITAVSRNTGTFTNTATVAVPEGYTDPNLANNSASAVVTVTLPQTDLVVTKGVSTNVSGPYASSLSVVTGQAMYFQIGIANNGPNVASNVVVNDLLPPGLNYLTNNAAGNPFTYNAATGVWTIGTVSPGGTSFMYLYAMGTNTGTFTNIATAPVPAGLMDPNLTNNSASAVVTVALPQADLVVTKGVSTNLAGPYAGSLSVVAGQTMYFQIGIANNGPNVASNVVVNDLLPPGLNYLTNNAAGNPFTYNAATGVWTVGTVYPGGTSFMYLYAMGTNTGTFTNIATAPVPAGLMDPNLTNNSASAVVKIYPVYSLSGYVRGCQTNGSAVPFTTVNLTGAATGSTLSGTNGFFSFSNLLSGSYTVTPVQPGNTFTPASATVTLNANTTLPVFLGAVGQIRGQLSYGTNGAVIAGALVALSGATNRTMLTDSNGVYAFTNAPPGTYTVTPVATNGYSFKPTNAVVILSVTNCTGQASFSAANRRVLLVALEVVQVSQDWSNSVPLIQAKKTFVRAHLQLPTNGPAVLLQGARLYGMGQAGALAGSPLTPYAPGRSPDFLVQTTNASALRGTFNNSLNFDIPPGWTTGILTLQLVATNNVTVVPTNTVSANSSVQVTFVNTVVPPLKFFGYNLTNWSTLDFQTVNAATYATVPARVTAIYPVPDITATRSVLVPPSTLNVPQAIPLTIPEEDRTTADWALLNANAKLLQMQALDWLLSLRFGYTNWIYCGILAGPSPGTLGWAGAFVTSSNTEATRAQNVSSSYLQPTLYGPGSARQTIPHEIGHNLGFPHDVNFRIFGINAKGFAIGSCNTGLTNGYQFPTFQPIPPPNGGLKPTLGPMTNGAPNSLVYGLDTFTLLNFPGTEPVANPYNCYDLMSYCRSNSPLERWNSTANYTGLRNAINTEFPPPPPPPPPGPPRQWRFIRGFVDVDTDVGGFEPFWTVTSTASTAPPAPPTGDYVAALLDANGNVIEAIPFTPVPFIIEETEAEEDLFSIPLLDNPAIHQVELVDMLNNTIVANIVAPTNLPSVSSVTLSATNGVPFTGSGPLVVQWKALDANPGAQLSYIIQYSTDGGTTWDTLDVDWPGTSYQVDSSYLQATTQGMIRVIVSDGFNSSAPADSSTFTIPNHPPTVSINSPADGEILIADGQAVFDVSATDPQDGPLDGASVQWSSSLDGVLGYGAVLDLEADLLTEGTHVITVTATDSEGLSSSAQVTIYVLSQAPPQLAIQLIGSQLQLSWPSSVTNYVLESTPSLAPSDWASVTNVPAAADITQTVILNQSTTNQFFRLRMP